jgi:hypothetical protein
MTQNVQVYNPFSSYFQQYKSYEQDVFNMHQNYHPEPEPHKNDAAPQHWLKYSNFFF